MGRSTILGATAGGSSRKPLLAAASRGGTMGRGSVWKTGQGGLNSDKVIEQMRPATGVDIDMLIEDVIAAVKLEIPIVKVVGVGMHPSMRKQCSKPLNSKRQPSTCGRGRNVRTQAPFAGHTLCP